MIQRWNFGCLSVNGNAGGVGSGGGCAGGVGSRSWGSSLKRSGCTTKTNGNASTRKVAETLVGILQVLVGEKTAGREAKAAKVEMAEAVGRNSGAGGALGGCAARWRIRRWPAR
jgi:hypothetical protein